jgi:hypothetical protein
MGWRLTAIKKALPKLMHSLRYCAAKLPIYYKINVCAERAQTRFKGFYDKIYRKKTKSIAI